jgi:hypothetical protein
LSRVFCSEESGMWGVEGAGDEEGEGVREGGRHAITRLTKKNSNPEAGLSVPTGLPRS